MAKKLFYIVGVIFIATCIFRYIDRYKPFSAETPKVAELTEEELIMRELKNEPKVKESFISGANILYVYVVDDGTRRDGFADYFCEVLRRLKVTTHKVKVMEYGSKKGGNYGNKLGDSRCK